MFKKLILSLVCFICIVAYVQAEEPKMTVYYFHGDVRCMSCNNMEKYTVSTVKEKFAEELADGSIEIKVVNVDRPENQHFVKDYKLYTKSVVLANSNGQWKNLDRIWSLIKNETHFKDYIEMEVGAYMKTP